MDNKRPAINPLRIINQLRAERGLISAYIKPKTVKPRRVTRAQVQQIGRDVIAELYPQALFDVDWVPGEYFAVRVAEEVRRRVAIAQGVLVPRRK